MLVDAAFLNVSYQWHVVKHNLKPEAGKRVLVSNPKWLKFYLEKIEVKSVQHVVWYQEQTFCSDSFSNLLIFYFCWGFLRRMLFLDPTPCLMVSWVSFSPKISMISFAEAEAHLLIKFSEQIVQ